jgi:hypothetical protein
MRKFLFLFTLVILLFSSGMMISAKNAGNNLDARVYLTPKPQVGQGISNVFSRTISYRPENTDEAVFRASGTAEYKVIESSADSLGMDGQFRYDGRPQSSGKTVIKDGGKTLCYKDKCGLNTDASGPVYNPFLWGSPKGAIRKDESWEVSIAEPWELGPAGKQTVTVVSIDPVNHSVTLKREGNGTGLFADEAKQIHVTKEGKSYLVDVVPGKAHWIGYTTFREGLVTNDELLVDRQVTFASKELGNVQGSQREYILLNAMPPHSQ